ncbi:MAG: putative metal-dependent hydrolase [Motiliproteus sp.]|jgi:predicted metal-dependent hydrolase
MKPQPVLTYISGYSPELQQQVQQLLNEDRLARFLLERYPAPHAVVNDKALRGYVMGLKERYLRKSDPLSKIVYDPKIHVINNALGLHSYVSRVQGGKLKSKNEIRIGSIFKKAPEAFLNMICVHELAHLKEKDHNKNFYQLCLHMQPRYHQLEFDMRVYLTQLELKGAIY